jgi:hypothetical protein
MAAQSHPGTSRSRQHTGTASRPRPFPQLASRPDSCLPWVPCPTLACTRPATALTRRPWAQMAADRGLQPPPELPPAHPALAGLVFWQRPPGPPPAASRPAIDLPGVRRRAGQRRPGPERSPSTASPACAAGCDGRRQHAAAGWRQKRGCPACLWRSACAPAAPGQPARLPATGRGAVLLQPHPGRAVQGDIHSRTGIGPAAVDRRSGPAA